jgi:drug/metabolite transporter (DMT)-like permease
MDNLPAERPTTTVRPPAGRTVVAAAATLVAVTAVWGSTFVLIKDVVRTLSLTDFLAVRFLIAAAVMLLVFWRQVRRLSRAQVNQALALGVVYGVGQVLQTAGLAQTSAAVSGFVTGMYVVLTPVLGLVLLKHRVSWATWLAVALATAGLGLLALRGFVIGTGELLVLFSALLYALHIVGLGSWARADHALGMATVQMLGIAALCTVAAAPGGLELPVTGRQWSVVLYTAVAAGAGAMIAQTWAQAHLSANRSAIIMTMEPVFSAGFAVGIGGEVLTTRLLAGGALVLAAMYVVEIGAAAPTPGRTTAPAARRRRWRGNRAAPRIHDRAR